MFVRSQNLSAKDRRVLGERVFWLGGGSGAGKSTVARRVAAQYGLELCATDDLMAVHADELSSAAAPCLAQFAAMGMDERWVDRSPQTMLETFHWFRGEGFELIVEDLLRLSVDSCVVVEGFRLLPQLVKPLLADVRRAVWLLPTPGFRRAAFESRGTLWEIPKRTSDPDRALANLLERDRLFTEQIAREARRLALSVVEVDISTTEDELIESVRRSFGIPAAPEPGDQKKPSRFGE